MSNKVKLNVYAFITVFLWAAAFPFTKAISGEFSPYSLGLIRCMVASAVLLIIGKALHIRKPFCRRDLLLLCAAGIAGFALYLIFFNTGLITITSATSSVIVASTPIMTAVVCSCLYNEKISPPGWVAIFFAFVGVVILMFRKGSLSIDVGVIWTLAAAVVFCIYNVLNRKLGSAGYSSMEIVTYGMVSATVVLLAFLPQSAADICNAEPASALIAVGLGLLPSATSYILWAKAMELAEKTNEVTNYMFITPLLSTAMGFLILGEVPDTGTVIGGAVIVAGVVLFGLKGK